MSTLAERTPNIPLITLHDAPSYALPSGFAVSVTVFAVIVINPAKK